MIGNLGILIPLHVTCSIKKPQDFEGREHVFLYREIEESHNFSTGLSSLDPHVCQRVPTSGHN